MAAMAPSKSLLRELEALGLLAPDEPTKQEVQQIKREYKYNMPKLDENGEPDF